MEFQFFNVLIHHLLSEGLTGSRDVLTNTWELSGGGGMCVQHSQGPGFKAQHYKTQTESISPRHCFACKASSLGLGLEDSGVETSLGYIKCVH